ncbi:unnamed protein product [Oikopleura dioica]|uniref:Uncharacterized protein n=1 Tax=Oikopleura dioica TaxID=34765 RepID=E4Y433_OIKDI|nr:unnamed protein product [Oikopleura dioica]
MKSEFEVKEKVLCYEPDENKARVLYDATIVEIAEKSSGREYMVHFQSWSKAFDRWVTKDLLMKQTEENKAHQLKLAKTLIKEKNPRQLKHVPGMKKIKKEMEAEETKTNGNNGGSLRSSARKRAVSTSQSEMSADEDAFTEDSYSSDNMPTIVLPDRLVFVLEEDHIKVEKKKRLLKLPAAMNVVQILENYIRHYAANMENVPHIVAELCTLHRTDTHLIDPDQYNLELIMEIVDDVRILFDHMLNIMLLYSSEKAQYKRLIENATLNTPNQISSPEPSTKSEENVFQQPATTQKKRPRTANDQLLDYNKKWLLREEDMDRTGIVKEEDGTRRSARKYTVEQSKGTRGLPNQSSKVQKVSPADTEGASKKKDAEKRVTRRSQLSTDCCIDLNPKIFVRRTSVTLSKKKDTSKTGTPDTLKSDGSGERVKDLDSPLNVIDHLSAYQFSENEIRRTLSLSTIWKWRMLPQNWKQPSVPPSLIYGAQHLLRLFVKVPELMERMNFRAKIRREMLLNVLNGIVSFLEAYEEDLFQDIAYESIMDA